MLVLPLLAVLVVSCQQEVRIDVSKNAGFRDLVGVCLLLRDDMFALRDREGEYSLYFRTEFSPELVGDWDHFFIDSATKVVISEIEVAGNFEGEVLDIFGEIEDEEGRSWKVALNVLFRARWIRSCFNLKGEYVGPQLRKDRLPLRDDIVERCEE